MTKLIIAFSIVANAPKNAVLFCFGKYYKESCVAHHSEELRVVAHDLPGIFAFQAILNK
jgi:hypothetical protein